LAAITRMATSIGATHRKSLRDRPPARILHPVARQEKQATPLSRIGGAIQLVDNFRNLTPKQRYTFVACFLGWTLDAFDFFILIFCVSAIAKTFHATLAAVLQAQFLTLALRPVGAFLFGRLADRYGRRPALMLNIICFSALELGSAFAPSLNALLILRACFGVAMGGEWGVGAALTFETLPARGRGLFSGLLQEGYAAGYLLAALVYGTLFQYIGWRGMFVVGAAPAFLVIWIRSRVDESPAWIQGRAARTPETRVARDVFDYLPSFLFLVVLMFGFNSLSHGTQDLYPTFLQKNRSLSTEMVGTVGVISAIGALLGGMVFGSWSERIGRRRAIAVAALLAIPVVPLWVFGSSTAILIVGAFLMQFLVQGAWGIVPAHLNELSPPAVRATFPGLAYQVGNLLASRNQVFQANIADARFQGSLAPVLAWTVVIVGTLVVAVTLSGREAKGTDLSATA
jgi:SHS family lactate transporter-like MFS transporter